MVVLAAISIYSWVIVGASFLTALAGILTWRVNFRSRQDDKRLRAAKMDAELIRAEHEGWVTLIESLRKELAITRHELFATRKELRTTQERVRLLERQSDNGQYQKTANSISSA